MGGGIKIWWGQSSGGGKCLGGGGMSKFWAGGRGGTSPHPPVGKTLLMKAPLSASQSVNQNHFFSKTANIIFTKFHPDFWFLKDKKVIPPRKNHFGKKSEISLKVAFHLCANFGFT